MSQTAGDLRTLVIRRAGSGRRVAVLGSDPALVRGIEANGCTVLVDPEGPEGLRAFAPDVVVGFDGLLAGSDGSAFRMLAEVAPAAELLLSWANAGSASALIRRLSGNEPPAGQSDAAVRGWLAAAGYAVVARDVVVTPFTPSGLASDAEASLRALLEQVNPDAAADRWLWVARRGPAAKASRMPGQLSVVRPGQSAEDATGQYVTFVREGDVVYRDHHQRLVAALKRSTSAWALESNVPALEALRKDQVACCAWVVDRERTGPFALALADEAPAAEAVLFARLLAVFPPVLVPGGPSYERKVPAPPIASALAAMQARPLQMLVTLNELMAEGPEPQLRDVLRGRLEKLIKR